MPKQNVRMLSRSFKRTSERKLTMRDLMVLDFLWMWKTASTPILKQHAYYSESDWWVYKSLRRLKEEKYIQLLPRGRNLDLELWALTKHGFEVVLMDRDDLEQYRFRVHAPAHDYLGTCLQLGDLWLSGIKADFYTEQQLSSLAPWTFPKGVRNIEGHIPDGVTFIRGALNTVKIGYEVDLNLKDEERYKSTIQYYQEQLKPNLVVWLVRNSWLGERIFSQISEASRFAHNYDLSTKCVFVLLDDFKENVWGAKVVSPHLQGMTLRNIHTNLIQKLYKTEAKLSQKPMKDIFFPKFKSPQKSMGLQKTNASESVLTPYGLREENIQSQSKNEEPSNE